MVFQGNDITVQVRIRINVDKEAIVLLVQEYQKYRVLWDAKNKLYYHKEKKNDAWDEIAKALGITAEDAKKKMLSLLGSFRREKGKATKALGTGKGASEVYKSDWFAFKSFAFLMDKNVPREPLNSESSLENIFESDEISQESDNNNNNIETPQTSSHEVNTLPPQTSSHEVNTLPPQTSSHEGNTLPPQTSSHETNTRKEFLKPTAPRRKKAKKSGIEDEKEDPRIDAAFQFLQKPSVQEDSTVKFGKYLVEKLNQFKSRTKAILIQKINTLVFDAEMCLIEGIEVSTDSPGSSCLSTISFSQVVLYDTQSTRISSFESPNVAVDVDVE